MEKKLNKTETKVLGAINQSIGTAGRATCKEEFSSAANDLHAGLKKMEKKLSKHRYLCGDTITEADIIEFVPLFRYDPLLSWVLMPNTTNTTDTLANDDTLAKEGTVDNRTLISKTYPNIWGWLQDMYQQPGVDATCDLLEIMNSKSFLSSFGARIIELGLDFPEDWVEQYQHELMQPHTREALSKHKLNENNQEMPAKKKQKPSVEGQPKDA